MVAELIDGDWLERKTTSGGARAVRELAIDITDAVPMLYQTSVPSALQVGDDSKDRSEVNLVVVLRTASIIHRS